MSPPNTFFCLVRMHLYVRARATPSVKGCNEISTWIARHYLTFEHSDFNVSFSAEFDLFFFFDILYYFINPICNKLTNSLRVSFKFRNIITSCGIDFWLETERVYNLTLRLKCYTMSRDDTVSIHLIRWSVRDCTRSRESSDYIAQLEKCDKKFRDWLPMKVPLCREFNDIERTTRLLRSHC